MKHCLIYGGSGSLGRALVSRFVSSSWRVTSIDFSENSEASANLVLDAKVTSSLDSTYYFIEKGLGPAKLDAIINVAGGWAGGNAASDDLFKNVNLMYNQSVDSSVVSAKLASKFLVERGLLTLTGATPCLSGTSGMIGYGMAKAAVHHLTKSLADPAAAGLPANVSTLAILPVTLDTPMNRKWMADADFSTWTPLAYVAQVIEGWASDPSKRPASGSLVKLLTKDHKTELVSV